MSRIMPATQLVAVATAMPTQVLCQCEVLKRAQCLFVTFRVVKESKSHVAASARTTCRHSPFVNRRVAHKYCDCAFSKWRRHWPTKEGPR